MVLIFVARDSSELSKYRNALDTTSSFLTWSAEDKGVGQDGSVVNPPCQSAGGRMSESEWLAGANEIDRQSRIEELRDAKIHYFQKQINEDDKTDYIVLLDRIPQKDEARDEAFNGDKGFPIDHVNTYIDIFSGIANKVVGKDVDDKEIFVFIHWGIVSPTKCEALFRAAVKSTKRNFNSFAVSTTRPKCFNVSGDKIQLPKTRQEACDVILRFTYDMVKDKFSDYIWSEQIEVTEDDISQMDFYLNGWMLPKLKEIAVNKDVWKVDAIKAWNEVKCNGYVDDKRKRVVSRDKRVVALFSELIQNGGAI